MRYEGLGAASGAVCVPRPKSFTSLRRGRPRPPHTKRPRGRHAVTPRQRKGNMAQSEDALAHITLLWQSPRPLCHCPQRQHGSMRRGACTNMAEADKRADNMAQSSDARGQHDSNAKSLHLDSMAESEEETRQYGAVRRRAAAHARAITQTEDAQPSPVRTTWRAARTRSDIMVPSAEAQGQHRASRRRDNKCTTNSRIRTGAGLWK